MSLTAITNNALSGLLAAQAGMRTTSNNVSNVNTPGYARQAVDLAARAVGGVGSGVDVTGIRRITDAYLATASLQAKSREAGAQATYELLDRAQAAFGDPTTGSSLFASVNDLFSAFAAAGVDPASPVRRATIVSDLDAMLGDFSRLSSELQSLRGEADARVAADVDRVNELLNEIVQLNADISRGAIHGDATGAENGLAQALDELSTLMEIRTVERSDGAVDVRTRDGVLLVGQTAAKLTYVSGGAAGAERIYPPITITTAGAPAMALDTHLGQGRIASTIHVRDKDLVALGLQLGEFAAMTADAINAAHNNNSSYPAPATLIGRNTGLLGTDDLGFTGASSVAVVDASGALVRRIDIDFAAQTIAVDGGGAVGFGPGATIDDLTTALNTALGAMGAATFTNGALTISASGGNGVAVIDDPANGSDRAGRAFAHFFGLNDLVRSTGPSFYQTGLEGTDLHGFAGGSTIGLKLAGPDGKSLANVSVTVTAGATIADLVTDLNTGVAPYGSFALDADGALAFTPAAAYGEVRLQVADDTTARGATGVSFSELFGVGEGPATNRAHNLAVRTDIAADTAKLALARIDLSSAALGEVVLGAGDASGAQALQKMSETPVRFAAAGDLPLTNTSVFDYSGRFAGDLGRRALTAERARDSADALRIEADGRRASIEGVNIEEEMVNLTTWQQAFNASSRLLQAAKDMSDILLSIV